MSAANPNPMEKSMVSVLVVANAGGGVAIAVGSSSDIHTPSHAHWKVVLAAASSALEFSSLVLPWATNATSSM
jgi:hypothetical protein